MKQRAEQRWKILRSPLFLYFPILYSVMDTDSNGMLYILGLASDARLTVTRNLDALDDNALKIENEAGSELPSTGGIGTTIFYMIGAMLVIGAGVILVTRRKMDA